MEFKHFRDAVATQFARMSRHDLFVADASGDELWERYLTSFPEGSNPIFRKRTGHDCSCCRQFVKRLGGLTALVDGKPTTIWDTQVESEPAYQEVADAMAGFVKGRPVRDTFLTDENRIGTERSLEDMLGGIHTWNHFSVNVPAKFVEKRAAIPTAQGKARDDFAVLKRSLDTISQEAVATILDLIAQNTLYKGAENKATLETFQGLKAKYVGLHPGDQVNFVWASSKTVGGAVARLRNTSIGTLLTDLSEGRDLEAAVKAYETMVAPTNYKRPTAIVTKGMILKAKEAVEALGLTSALERRYATLEDITIGNLLYADRSVRRRLTSNVFDDLAQGVPEKPKLDAVEDMPIEKFLADVLPTAQSIELMAENRHTGNFVSLIAPTDPTAGRLFKWDNPFSWSYSGDFTDSVKERVKAAGGNVVGDLCCRLAWYNYDDLDFHMLEPSGHKIYFGTRHRESPAGGRLDVDMNAGQGTTRQPVENIFYRNRAKLQNGLYTLFVHNYFKRESVDVGFEVELDWLGKVTNFAYPQAVAQGAQVIVAKFRYERGALQIVESLPSAKTSREVWGLSTETFRKVDAIMLSPNYWDGQGVGNKHWFFMLEGCRNEGVARGFYNEFLSQELAGQRKALELVGSKLKTDKADSQLSGLGFSSTQRNSVLCRVRGSFTRVLNLVF